MDLKGVVALVTGGKWRARAADLPRLRPAGRAHVAVMYGRSRDQAESVASELASRYQIDAQAFGCDITDDAAVDRLVGEVTQAFGRLDVLINDAAYNVSIPFGDLDSLTPEVGQDHGHQPDGADAPDQGRSSYHEGPGVRPHHQHRFGSWAQPNRVFYRLCRLEGGTHSSDALYGGRTGT